MSVSNSPSSNSAAAVMDPETPELSEDELIRRRSPWNLPNIITLSRLGLSLVLFGMINSRMNWELSAGLFTFAAATDFIDGHIARKYGLVTVLGRILDPFVDKVIVCGAFVFLLPEPGSGVTAWMTIAVIGREMFVTSIRSFLEQQGKDFSAVLSGKLKMLLQCVAVVAALLSLSPRFGAESSWHGSFLWTRDILLWGATAVTLYSGYIYAVRAISLFRGANRR